MIRTFAFACAIAALSTSPTWAQSNTPPSPQASPTAPANAAAPASPAAPASVATPAKPMAAKSADTFVKSQSLDEWRAAKLVGVTVVGADNKKIGRITDVLIDHDGSARAIVIGAGGFLGIGGKTVAVPFRAMKWRTEGRIVQVAQSPSAGGSASTGAEVAKTDPVATEANQGYPDVAVLDMTEAQVKTAPNFNYAPAPAAPGAEASMPKPPAGAAGAPRKP